MPRWRGIFINDSDQDKVIPPISQRRVCALLCAAMHTALVIQMMEPTSNSRKRASTTENLEHTIGITKTTLESHASFSALTIGSQGRNA